MTAAGLASLFVCYDNLSLKSFERCDSSGTELQSALRGLKWFNDHFDDMISEKTPFSTPGNAADLYYFLYGVDRVALASGYKYFGKSDWYRTGVKRLLETVTSGGAWPHHYSNTDGTPRDDVSTAFALLFLVRGRNAVLFNKLQFPSVGTRKNETNTTDWNCRPRDIAMVTAWLGRTYEMSLNWQIVSLQETPIAEWHDAPVLYIGGSKEPRFLDQDLIKLRKYVLQGGTILSCTECNGAGFRKGIREAYKRMFPEYEMISLPLTHELCTKVSHFDLNGRPRFYAITNGVRLLAIHVDDDLPMAWQQCQIRTKSWAFDAAANLFMYLTDRGKLHRRAASSGPMKSRSPRRTGPPRSCASAGAATGTRSRWRWSGSRPCSARIPRSTSRPARRSTSRTSARAERPSRSSAAWVM